MSATLRKILIIDDDSFLLDMYSAKFSKVGYETKIAISGPEALKILRDGYDPSVVLADIVMPEMNGLDMVATIRAEKLIPKATIIMLTNQDAPEDIARSKKLNIDGYIVKATTIPSEVLAETRRFVARRNLDFHRS